MLTRVKQKFQSKIASVAEKLCGLGLSPNMMSVLGVALAVLCAVVYAKAKGSPQLLFSAAVLLLLSGLCDGLDGAMARLCSRATAFGGFFDSVLDRYVDAIVYSSIIIGGLCEFHWGLMAMVGSLLVSYTRARAEMERVKMETVGLMERPERILALAIFTLLEICWTDLLKWGMIFLAVMTNLTALQRIVYFYNRTKKAEKEA